MTAAIVALYPTSHPSIEPVPPPVYPDHHEHPVTAGHACALRILAECRRCGAAYNHCDADEADVVALLEGRWIGPECAP